MSKKKIETYRIKDLSSGLYYTGGIYAEQKNPNYIADLYERERLRQNAEKTWTFQEKKDKDYWSGPWPWNERCKEKWNSVGKIFTNLRGAEKSLSELTGVPIHTRKNKAKNILFGNKKSNNYVIVRCRILDRNDKISKTLQTKNE